MAERGISQSGTPRFVPRRFLGRLYLFAAVLTVDHLLLGAFPHSVALLGQLGSWGMVSFAVFVGLGYSRLKLFKEELPFNAWFFDAHLLVVCAVCLGRLEALRLFGISLDSGAGWLIARTGLLFAIALLALAFLPLKSWVTAIRTTSPLWLFAILAGGCAFYLREPLRSLWEKPSYGQGRILQVMTFHSVHAVLSFGFSNIVFDPTTFMIGTPSFSVILLGGCSGLEGLGMVLVFTIVWLTYFRKESRLPQALLLIPIALVLVWMLNVVRICALILIGNAGYPDVAMTGFHSQAGWVAFTAVAFAFSVATQKLSWVRRTLSVSPSAGGDSALAGVVRGPGIAAEPAQETGESPATRAYLIPFLAILAASFVSKAASGNFEWLYPLRFVCAAVAIWFFRAELKKLNWRFGWMAPLTGATVFLVWIASAWWIKEPSGSELGQALAALSPAARLTWIAFRVAAAVVTVPIAEELAFRGYLARRVMNREFDAIPFTSLTILAIGVSSVVFGLLHGQLWIAGILAGLAYSAVLKGRGRIGDAVLAHATSNLLLAVWVLLRGDWGQW